MLKIGCLGVIFTFIEPILDTEKSSNQSRQNGTCRDKPRSRAIIST